MAKMGRPPKRARDRRTARVMVRLTARERRELQADADAAGLSLSMYLLRVWQGSRGRSDA